ncbi:hypothetical protein SAMN05216338_1003303 [Bradyrhizobium sp. Rc2d]|nr:hypothetical protein SAMN05216338_1003303 [Bradyrhizobium sp. Rc2d]
MPALWVCETFGTSCSSYNPHQSLTRLTLEMLYLRTSE